METWCYTVSSIGSADIGVSYTRCSRHVHASRVGGRLAGFGADWQGLWQTEQGLGQTGRVCGRLSMVWGRLSGFRQTEQGLGQTEQGLGLTGRVWGSMTWVCGRLKAGVGAD